MHFLKFKELNRFLVLGSLNFLITNVLLQIMLLFFDVWLSTALSQIFNSFFGFLIYSRFVFNNKNFQIIRIQRFLILSIISYSLNSFLITYLSFIYNYSKNLAAFIILPFLTIFSYMTQKLFIFKK